MLIDTSETSPRDLYRLLIGVVVPRPIAWISTVSKDGINNLAPFSFFNVFSANPPILGVGIGSKSQPDGKIVAKDTYQNIIDTKQFVVNVVSYPLAEKMNHSSGEFKAHIDEFEQCGLTPLPSKSIKAPRMREAPVSMECELFKTIPLGNNNLVLGKILTIHVEDRVLIKGRIDLEKLEPVGRLSGISYCKVDSIFQIERPNIDPD